MKGSARRIILLITLTIGGQTLQSQSISIDFPLIENEIRRQVISGKLEGISFSHRPIHITKQDTSFRKYESAISKSLIAKRFIDFRILAVQQNFEFNSHYPFGWNNGAMIRSRGLQSLTTGGVFSQVGPLIFQFSPVMVFAQNSNYPSFPSSHNQSIWDARVFTIWNYADYPEYFGSKSYQKITLGNSFIGVRYKKMDLILSNENLWWGPSQIHSLTMTNNSAGFLHLSLKPNRGLKTPIGSFYPELLVGKLDRSGFPANESLQWLYDQKRDDWRYLSAINLSYQPNWFQGFEIGFIRTLQQYFKTTQQEKAYFPVLLSISREGTGGGADEIDQQASLYTHYTFSASSAEVYAEIGRNDSPWDLRDFNMSPDHSLAYVIGFSKSFSVKDYSATWTSEVIKLSKGGTGVFRDEPSWYLNGLVSHGYTQRGEFIGSGLRPGSQSVHNRLSMETNFGRVGLQLDRISNEEDFYFTVMLPNGEQEPWIDWVTGASLSRQIRKLRVFSELNWVHSKNYYWENQTSETGIQNIAKNRNNLFIRLQTVYSF